MATTPSLGPQLSRSDTPAGQFNHGRARRNLLISALASSALLIGAFPHLDWGWLAWFALVPFFLLFPQPRLRAALGLGTLFGMVFFSGLFYWCAVFAGHAIGRSLGTVVWLGMALIQTVPILIFAAVAQGLSRLRSIWAWRLGVPAAWVLLEWTRQLGTFGMGWGDLGYTQHRALAMLQLTKVTGVWGLSFLIVLVNVAISEVWRCRRISKFVGATALLVAAVFSFGVLAVSTEHLRPTFRAAALQADINQNVTFDAAYKQRVLQTFSAQERLAAAQGATLVVWPETALPGYLRYDAPLQNAVLGDALRNHQNVLVGGADEDLGARKPTNTLFVVSAQGRIVGEYSKQHLVPFGEYVPYRKYLPWLERLHLAIFDEAPGAPDQPLPDAGPPIGLIGAGICYDSTYGPLMRVETRRGANLLVISTDDTWFGRTAAARQHGAMSAVRAAENDRYLIRCAATGVSEVVDPTGRVIREAGLFRRVVVVAPVESRHTITPYVRWGDWFVAACALLLMGLLVWNYRRARELVDISRRQR